MDSEKLNQLSEKFCTLIDSDDELSVLTPEELEEIFENVVGQYRDAQDA